MTWSSCSAQPGLMHCPSPQLAACQPSRTSSSQHVSLPCARRSNGYCDHFNHFCSPQGQRLELTRQIPVTRAACADDSRHNSGSSGSSSGGIVGLVKKWHQDSKQMQEQLKALGAAGVIAYGEDLVTPPPLTTATCSSSAVAVSWSHLTNPTINSVS